MASIAPIFRRQQPTINQLVRSHNRKWFLRFYDQANEDFPKLTKGVTGLFLGAISDTAAQFLQNRGTAEAPAPMKADETTCQQPGFDVSADSELRQEDLSKTGWNFDWNRFRAFACYNALWSAGPLHYFVLFLNSEKHFALSLVKKMWITHLVYNPFIYIPGFYYINGVLKGDDLDTCTRTLLSDGLGGYTQCSWFWFPVNVIQYAFVPAQLQVLYINGCGIFWGIILSSLSNKTRTTVGEKEVEDLKPFDLQETICTKICDTLGEKGLEELANQLGIPKTLVLPNSAAQALQEEDSHEANKPKTLLEHLFRLTSVSDGRFMHKGKPIFEDKPDRASRVAQTHSVLLPRSLLHSGQLQHRAVPTFGGHDKIRLNECHSPMNDLAALATDPHSAKVIFECSERVQINSGVLDWGTNREVDGNAHIEGSNADTSSKSFKDTIHEAVGIKIPTEAEKKMNNGTSNGVSNGNGEIVQSADVPNTMNGTVSGAEIATNGNPDTAPVATGCAPRGTITLALSGKSFESSVDGKSTTGSAASTLERVFKPDEEDLFTANRLRSNCHGRVRSPKRQKSQDPSKEENLFKYG